MPEGTIFDIQRFALHDGPGIRSVVFLKGCALHCRWCCNPESVSPRPQLVHKKRLCTGCLSCTERCPAGALTAGNGGLIVDYGRCTACGACVVVCPSSALSVAGTRRESGELVQELLRDRPYFDASDGGITLSGGEALCQRDFAVGILREAKKQGLHTCVETSGSAAPDSYEEAARWTDLFLFDYKLSDEAAFREYTGGSLRTVESNLQLLDRLGCRIILRTLIVPGVNDREEHFRNIVRLQREMRHIAGIEVSPLHNFGAQKYRDLGQAVPELFAAAPPQERTAEWIEAIVREGGKNVGYA